MMASERRVRNSAHISPLLQPLYQPTLADILQCNLDVRFGSKQTCALQQPMSALPPIATANADFRTGSCLLYPRKRTWVQCTSLCLLCANSGHGVHSCKVDLVKQRLGANHATWHPFRSRAATDDDSIFSHFRRGCS